MKVIQTDWGIGDVICSLYAVQGWVNEHPKQPITFYTRRHLEWAKLADIPEMKVKAYRDSMVIKDGVFMYNVSRDKDRRMKHTNSPKKMFARKLGVEPAIPRLITAITNAAPHISGDYIVIAPFAGKLHRTWEVHNWKMLAKELTAAGYKVIAIDGPGQKDRCSMLEVEHFAGETAAWTANVCLNAKAVISNDSGIAHLGGWLGTKTLVLMSQLRPEQYYDLTENRFIIPQQKCTACQFLPERGYEPNCDSGCWVLQSISPKEVFEETIKWLKGSITP